MHSSATRLSFVAVGLALTLLGCEDGTNGSSGTAGTGGVINTGGAAGSGGLAGTGDAGGESGVGGGTNGSGVDPEVRKAAGEAACENIVLCTGVSTQEECTSFVAMTFEELAPECQKLYLTRLECEADADCSEFGMDPRPCGIEAAAARDCAASSEP